MATARRRFDATASQQQQQQQQAPRDTMPLWQRRAHKGNSNTADIGESFFANSRSSSSAYSSTDDDIGEQEKRRSPSDARLTISPPGDTDFDRRERAMDPDDFDDYFHRTSEVNRSRSFRTGDASPGREANGRRSASPYGYPQQRGQTVTYAQQTRSPYQSQQQQRGYSRAATDRLTADYVPSWRPDRRFSTPAVERHRRSTSRSPSPRFIGRDQLHLDNFRHRAASLPVSPNTALSQSDRRRINNAAAGKRKNHPGNAAHPDYWPRARSPSRVEQRFLKLSESADYDKVRSFVVGSKGELVERGFCYRHRSETTSSSSGSITATASPNEDVQNGHQMDGDKEVCIVPRYPILVIGANAVGKTALMSLLTRDDEHEDGASDEQTTTIPVLICGEEFHLEFVEHSTVEVHTLSPLTYKAIVVVYSVADKRSFSTAADILYRLRAEVAFKESQRSEQVLEESPTSAPFPLVLIGNKIDLERQRQVHEQDGAELAKSYNCRFLEVSAALEHRIEDLLGAVMNEIWRQTLFVYSQHKQRPDASSSRHPGSEQQGNEKKSKRRFSFKPSAHKNDNRKTSTFSQQSDQEGKRRSTRGGSLYVLPGQTLLSPNYGAPPDAQQVTSSRGLLSRLLNRRSFRSCEDLFSRLLRG